MSAARGKDGTARRGRSPGFFEKLMRWFGETLFARSRGHMDGFDRANRRPTNNPGNFRDQRPAHLKRVKHQPIQYYGSRKGSDVYVDLGRLREQLLEDRRVAAAVEPVPRDLRRNHGWRQQIYDCNYITVWYVRVSNIDFLEWRKKNRKKKNGEKKPKKKKNSSLGDCEDYFCTTIENRIFLFFFVFRNKMYIAHVILYYDYILFVKLLSTLFDTLFRWTRRFPLLRPRDKFISMCVRDDDNGTTEPLAGWNGKI